MTSPEPGDTASSIARALGDTDPVTDGLASTPPGAVPGREDHPLNDTDAATGFGDPDREVAPGVVVPDQSS